MTTTNQTHTATLVKMMANDNCNDDSITYLSTNRLIDAHRHALENEGVENEITEFFGAYSGPSVASLESEMSKRGIL